MGEKKRRVPLVKAGESEKGSPCGGQGRDGGQGPRGYKNLDLTEKGKSAVFAATYRRVQ